MGLNFLKGSSATSGPATAPQPASGRSSAKAEAANPSASPLSPIADGGYPLAGPSDLPDPQFHAYRKDLADAALAGRVIASHYAEPLQRHLSHDALVHLAANEESDVVARLASGDEFAMLDSTGGWAWGYAGAERRVGYVRADAVGA